MAATRARGGPEGRPARPNHVQKRRRQRRTGHVAVASRTSFFDVNASVLALDVLTRCHCQSTPPRSDASAIHRLAREEAGRESRREAASSWYRRRCRQRHGRQFVKHDVRASSLVVYVEKRRRADSRAVADHLTVQEVTSRAVDRTESASLEVD